METQEPPNPPVSPAELVAQLGSRNENSQRLAAFKLQDQIGDPSFADEFTAQGGMTALQALMLKAKGNILSYTLASFTNLLALDQGWSSVNPEVTDRLVDLVVTGSVNVQRGAMTVLVYIINRPQDSPQSEQNYRFLLSAIAARPNFYDHLVTTLSSPDHALCAVTLSVINALMRDVLLTSPEEGWSKFIHKLQGLGIVKSVFALMQSAGLNELNSPLLEYQFLTKVLLRRWREIPFDLGRQDHRRALKAVYTASKPKDEAKEDDAVQRVDQSRWQRLGFDTGTPETAFAETGYLGMVDLLAYVKRDEDAFQRLLLEQSKKPANRRCPVARASLAVTSILYAHFEAQEANENEQLLKSHMMEWPRLHAAGVAAFFRLWASTGAEADDFVKMQELVRVLVEQVVSLAPRTAPTEKLEESMGKYSVQQLRDLQMGLLELTHDEALGQHIRQMRDDLRHEATQFMREQRTRCLLRGSWFPNAHHAANAAGGVASWRFARLSHTRRQLHYDDFAQRTPPGQEPSLDELDLRLDLSAVSHVVTASPTAPSNASTGATATAAAASDSKSHEIVIHGYPPSTSPNLSSKSPQLGVSANLQPAHARHASVRSSAAAAGASSSRSAGASSSGNSQQQRRQQDSREPVPLLTLHATGEAHAAEWFDGLLLLLGQTPVTAATERMVALVADYGLKMRLLNVRSDEALGGIGRASAGAGGAATGGAYGRHVAVPSRAGADDGDFWYDVGRV